ncbi:MAG: tetratricopeptide repeat protein [Flavobacteriaceae bacterium]|nr:tetratricopeptide repeat protein [Flavobacteriaceae bacterium]
MRQILLIAFTFLSALSFSQKELEDKALERSNAYIYDANEKVNNDFVSAEMAYRKAVSAKPTNAPGSYNLGNAYYKSGLYDEALIRHLEAVKTAGNKTDRHKAFHNIGNILMQQEQCKKAVEAFKNALRNNPSDDETRYNLALAKECANKDGEGDDGENDQKEDDKEDQKKDEKDQDKEDKDEGDENKDEENKDQGDDDQDKKDGDDKDDENGKPKDDKDDKKDGQPKDDKQKKQPQPGKLSPQQVKNLLEAMNNEEKKVQDKINAKKVKGTKVKTEKDW